MLCIVATPIGNLEDITLRALRVLKEADYVLAEDTRKTGMMLKRYGLKKRMLSFFEHNEEKKIPEIIEDLSAGKIICLVSSAGTPTVSDPGYKLVRAARKQSLPVTSLPGASSIINALALTSLAHERFVFMGYFPRKASERRKACEKVKASGLTTVFFESPYRVLSAVESLSQEIEGARVALMREMTKKFEEVIEGDVKEVLSRLKGRKLKGEIVLAVNAPNP
ncbi:MAG: 16S rRNA (cytidine(1402)-2'-O)-methyltransferase [Candidatus Omnitrophica bacterium]|nr:16S rRNA (cytidine(1402)-2'-O)-methyltransferase [Candidatus Omnitrophota bacterium]